MTSPVILSMDVLETPEPQRRGETILARFDIEIGGVVLRGCALLRREAKGLQVWSPSKHATFNAGTRRNVKAAALRAYNELDRP